MSFNQYALLRATSRTFALSIEHLPGHVREALCLAYLILRISDFLEDNDYMPVERKVALLQLWDHILAGQASAAELVAALADRAPAEADAQAAHQAPEILAALGRLPPALQTHVLVHCRNTTQGMARWVARGPDIPAEGDMDDYMHEVAGRVGYLVTDIFAWYSGWIRSRRGALMPLAREFGLALQTVNVIRGLRKDYERGWIFVPESFCAAVDLRRADLFNPAYQLQALQVLDMLGDKAERHLHVALAFVKTLPRWLHGLRLACIWPLLFAVRTLALSRHNVNVLIGEVKMTRAEVQTIVRDSTLFGWSNSWLDQYVQHLRIAPLIPGAGDPGAGPSASRPSAG
ncbi:MAG: squalene/phytoene synthase family protein [Anaerolineales bacterium]|nr:squalene/phytoene synthase family protein [Anaerolineales bacterium]